jgi:hypothetical protein
MTWARGPAKGSTASDASAPPHPFDKGWHVHINGKTYGPCSGHQIRQLVEQNRIAGSDLVYVQGESGSAWHQIAHDPVLGALFKSSEKPRSPLVPRIEALRLRRKWLFAIPVAVIAGWIAWPYYAAYDLLVAVREGDVSTLETRVAWESVRQGLRGDLNAALLQNISTGAKTDSSSGEALGSGLAMVLGPVIVDRIVDSYVTPQGVAAVNRANKTDNISPDAPNASKNFDETIQAARHIRWNQIKYAFFSGGPLTFVAQIIPDRDPPLQHPVGFRFQWDGNWRLTRIMLPSDVTDEFATAKNQTGIGSQLTNKAVTGRSPTSPEPSLSTPSTLQITLVSKGFKSRNIQAGDFEDDITIQIAITNVLDKDIRAFDGVLTFTDLLDNKILSSKIAINESLKAGAALNWKGSIKYNQFEDEHQRLRNEPQTNLKIRFATRKILFADGTTKEY